MKNTSLLGGVAAGATSGRVDRRSKTWLATLLAGSALAVAACDGDRTARPDPVSTGGAGGAHDDGDEGDGASQASGASNRPSVRGASCADAEPSCGPDRSSDCCASFVVPGGTFVRDNGISGDFRATISDFRLDAYEVTVGRFKKFASGYAEHKPAAGSGRNPNNGSDKGWDAAWNESLPEDEEQLIQSVLSCDERFTTFAAGDDALPMNCITWFEAYAFCIWDGGRLPTDAELNYAAAGGSEQRVYPWSNPPDREDLDDSHAVFLPHAEGPAPVGSRSPLGDGRWGHADLSGNEWEWCQDWYQSHPPVCFNCANLSHYSIRVIRGGSFYGNGESLRSSGRLYHAPNHADFGVGVRCARAP